MSDKPNSNARPASEQVDVGPKEFEDAKIIGQLSPEQTGQIRERQNARSKVMGIILLGLCVLFFAITIVKIGVWG